MKDPEKKTFIEHLRKMTREGTSQWKERRGNEGIYLRTEFKGFDIDLIKDFDEIPAVEEGSESTVDVEKYFMRVSKHKGFMEPEIKSALIYFDEINQFAAQNLFDVASEDKKVVLSNAEKGQKRNEMEELGFLTAQNPKQLIKVLTGLGFVRQP